MKTVNVEHPNQIHFDEPWQAKVRYTLIQEEEDCPIRGNCIVSDDDELDKQVEDELIKRLESGDLWAWCCLKVVATLPGIDLEGSDGLGECSYENEAQFVQGGGYFDDMCNEALADLTEQVHEIQAILP